MHVSEYDPYSPTIRKKDSFTNRLLLVRMHKHYWYYRVTYPGKILLFAFFLSGVGTISVSVPIYNLFSVLMALILIDGIVSWIFRPHCDLRGDFPAQTTAGQPAVGHFTVTNKGWLPIYDLAVSFRWLEKPLSQTDRDDTLDYLPRGESVDMTVTIDAPQRGFYALPKLGVHTLFPFHLNRSGSAALPGKSLLVLPAFHQLTSVDLPVGSKFQPGGIALTSNVGESPEYVGNREYVPGEPARRLDFRSWARLGKPVVREYQEEYYCRIALILDTYMPNDSWLVRKLKSLRQRYQPKTDYGQSMNVLEAGISLTASIADALSRGEYLIDLFAAGPELYVFRAGRHTAHFDNVLEILSCVDRCPDDPFETIGPAVFEELSNVSTAVCIFLDWDEQREKMARAVLDSGSSLKTIIIHEGETTKPYNSDEFGQAWHFTPDKIAKGKVESL
ncbi:DUF58 domain-containing protein [Gimesia fumaroli]|uniref:Uncharacterized protein n=1 Tax=Gimesia fumaroli TaxID=2527976 RepID=A0A518I5D6_9PLAN|nr:DUF58 domain-containing protein [Gimesia fumaroli]QDV48287.1 hypothetical protein Enr17x_02980 [Gimesia fumaroli]